MTAARARIHAMFTLDEQAETELDRRLNDFGADTIRKGVNAASIIHHACRRSPASCIGCQVRADILDALSSVADVIEEKATTPAATATPDARQAARLEAADWFASSLNAETTDWARGRGDAIAWVIGILRNPDPQRGEQQTEFFRPGRTYLFTRLGWKFRCDAVTSHPDTGKRVAVGYSHFGHGKWQTGDLSEGIWAEGGWTDVTETESAR